MALQDKKIMPPPWLAYREIERYSIGWHPLSRAGDLEGLVG